MGHSASKLGSKDLTAIDLAAYEDACKTDDEVNRFDDALKTRTGRVLNAIANGIDHDAALSFDSLTEITSGLLETDQEVVRFILQHKHDVWHNPDLFQLVEEFFDHSLATLDLCSALDKSIKASRDQQLIIQVALNLIPSSGELIPPDCERIMKELHQFAASPTPFGEDFVRMFHKVRERHLQMLEKLVEKKRRLDKKLKGVKVWKKVSTIMFGALVAVLLICSVVAAAIAAPPIASAMAATSSLPLQSMGRWVKSLWNGYEKELRIQKELVEDMYIGTYVVIKDLETIKILVSNLENVLKYMVLSIPSSDQERDPVAVKMMVEDISKKRDVFFTELDDFEQHIDRCRTHIVQARTIVLQRIIRRPERSRRPGSF